MSPRRIVIVGAGPAGFATARAYRQNGGSAQVTMLGAETLRPYRRPPLTKEFLRGQLDAAELPLEPPEWFRRQDVRLRLGCRARAIDPEAGTVELDDDTLRAEQIVLATGAEPTRPDLPGLQDRRVQTIRERPDSERVAEHAKRGAHTVVLGTGFIGCELATSLALIGARVTLVGQEDAPQRRRLGEQAAARIADWLARLGVDLKLGAAVCSVHDGRVVELAGGERIEADRVVLGMGVRPRVELAERAGLAIGEGAIVTDAQMRAHERVLAVGDVAYAHNRCAGRRLRVEHWGDALGQGELAGRVLAGQDAQWQDVPGFWSTIGQHTLKYAAWGDGYEDSRFEEHPGGAFAVWYSRGGKLVGALTHERDGDYERARRLIAAGESPP